MRLELTSIALAGLIVAMAFALPSGNIATDWQLGPTGDGGTDPLTSSPNQFEWLDQFGTKGRDFGMDVFSTMSATYVVGYTMGSLDGQSHLGLEDAYIRKYDPNGMVLWTRQFGTSSNEEALGVAVDSHGIYVCGFTRGALPGETLHGLSDGFVCMFDGSGTLQWTYQFGSSVSTVARDIFATGEGIYVIGEVIDGLLGEQWNGGRDAFLLKLDHSGSLSWVDQFGTQASDIGRGVWAYSPDEIFIAGETEGRFRGCTNLGSTDVFVRLYNRAGHWQWQEMFGTAGEDWVEDVYMASYWDMMVTGSTRGSFPGFTNQGGSDCFVIQFTQDTMLNPTIIQFGTPDWDLAYAISSDGQGIYVGGCTMGSLGGPNQGNDDAFIRKYDMSMNEEWTAQFGSNLNDVVLGLCVHSSRVDFSGTTSGTLPGQSSHSFWDAFAGTLDVAPVINPSPSSVDFGEVDIWDEVPTTVTFTNFGFTTLVIAHISISDGGSPYISITTAPTTPILLNHGDTTDVTVRYNPWEVGSHVAELQIWCDDPDNSDLRIPIEGSSVQPVLPPEDLVEDTGDFFDDATEDGDLVGTGGGNSGDERLADLRDKLDDAIAMIEAGDIEDAIGILNAILKKCDGDPKPPDHVVGEAAEELASRIQWLIETLEGE